MQRLRRNLQFPGPLKRTRVQVVPTGTPVFGLFDVRDFGAVGNGTTDDTQAFKDTITAIVAANGGELLVPPGTYKLTEKLNVPNVALGIRGFGRDLSLLVWENTSIGGIEFSVAPPAQIPVPGNEWNGRGRSLRVEGISLQTRMEGGGTALRASWPLTEFLPTMDTYFSMEDVRISGLGQPARNPGTTGLSCPTLPLLEHAIATFVAILSHSRPVLIPVTTGSD